MVKVDVGPCPTGLLEENAVREYTIVDLEAADKAYGEFSVLLLSLYFLSNCYNLK